MSYFTTPQWLTLLRGLPPSAEPCAASARWLAVLIAMLKSGTEYDPTRRQKAVVPESSV